MTGKEAVLSAFDRLFDRAAAKLGVAYDEQEREEAKRTFAARFSATLDVAAQVRIAGIPDDVMQDMENAIERLSPAQVVAHLATIPLALQVQEMLRVIAYQSAQQRYLDHLISQADDSYGGN